jgi:uncharacterized protein YutE (UPF0331/DUF86 family)
LNPAIQHVPNPKLLAHLLDLHRLAPSTGLRYRLVHEYDRIDHSILLKAVTMAEELYPEYVEEISAVLSRQD